MRGNEYKRSAYEGEASLATSLYQLTTRVEDTNKLIMTLIRKIELLEKKIEELEAGKARGMKAELEEPILSPVDEQIMSLVKSRGEVSAADVKAELHYKGTNAASARLNKLCSIGLLKKAYVGKKVYFFLARWPSPTNRGGLREGLKELNRS